MTTFAYVLSANSNDNGDDKTVHTEQKQ